MSSVVVADVERQARQARAEWRTRELLHAAARVMQREGFAGVSVQALAEEAGVSVGLIYRYFGSKQDLLLGVIVDVLDALAARVPAAMDEVASADPVERLAAGFRAYCQVMDERRHAALLTYRESRALSLEGLERVKDLELQTRKPLLDAVRAGVADGALEVADPELFSQDLLLLAHGWALKHWYFAQSVSLSGYVDRQLALMLRAVVPSRRRSRYAALLRLPAPGGAGLWRSDPPCCPARRPRSSSNGGCG